MTTEEYYTPPSQEIFEDIKQGAIQLWSTYDDTYKYASDKIGRITDITNVSDNYAYMIAMFDMPNKQRLISFLKDSQTKEVVYKLIDMEMESLSKFL